MLKNSKTAFPACRRLALISGLSLSLAVAPALAHAELPMVTEQTQDFLSNRSSVGALVGGILAGAAFATPLAPLGGTVLGFFVGKSTDFSKDKEAAGSYQRRSFAPANSGDFNGTQLALSDSSEAASGTLRVASADLQEAPTGKMLDVSSEAKSDADEPLQGISRGSDEKANGSTPPSADADVSLASEEALTEASKLAKPTSEPVNLVITKEVGVTQNKLDVYADIIRKEQEREEFEPNPLCPGADAPKYRKKLAVAGFPLEHPEQSVFGGLNNVGKAVSSSLYQRLEQSQRVQAYSAPQWQMFASSSMAPTMMLGSSNRLGKYSAVSREMGAQFVMSGIIRDVSISDPKAWSTDYGSKMKRAVFGSDTRRNFELDMVVHDGYTGRVIMEKRYSGSGEWDVPRNKQVAFGSDRFFNTAYGQAVEKVLADMASDVLAQLDCQPMLVPITEVAGKDLLLDVGTPSGLLPGAKMRLVRAESSLARPDEPAQLWDTDVELHIHSLSLDSARAWMPKLGSQINIQRGDYAVIY